MKTTSATGKSATPVLLRSPVFSAAQHRKLLTSVFPALKSSLRPKRDSLHRKQQPPVLFAFGSALPGKVYTGSSSMSLRKKKDS